MKKILLSLIVTAVFFIVGNAQDNNTSLALRRMLMVTSVELLQRSTPTATTKEDFNKQLIENEASKEGVVFLNQAFEFYNKEISTEKILTSYDGKESIELIKYVNNGGQNVFGNINNTTAPERNTLKKWLKDTLTGILEVVFIAINICNVIPWPC